MKTNASLLTVVGLSVALGCTAQVNDTKGVTISPTVAQVLVGESVTFTATVKGLSDATVTWSVDEDNGGTIDDQGVYTAPDSPGTFHVSATSVVDEKYRATASVLVGSPLISVSVGPQVVWVQPLQQVLFGSRVTGTRSSEPTSVTWSVEGAGGGTIDASGMYTAPATAGVFRVLATSDADPTKVEAATVNVGGSSVVPADRNTIWNPGLMSVGGIPRRSTVYRDIAPSGGDDTATIQAALDSCPAGQVVKLAAGNFLISGDGLSITHDNVVLRGEGPLTRLSRTDTRSYPVAIIGPRWANGKLIKSIDLASDGKKDSYSITLASAPSPAYAPGELVYLDQDTNPDVTEWSVSSPPGNASRGWFSRMDKPVTQVLEVASASGTTVSFTTPLHIDFLTQFKAQLSRHGSGSSLTRATRFSGIENLFVEKGKGGDGGGNIHLFLCAYCWVDGVESNLSSGSAINFDSSFRSQLSNSYIHTSADPNPGGAGYLVSLNQGSADNLVENNVIWSGNKVIVMRASGGGNVIAYNLAQDAFGAGYLTFVEVGLNAAHMTTAHVELFEGNESFNFDADATWGNAAYITVFRNNFTGLRASKAPLVLSDRGNRRAIGLTKGSWWYTFVGNVLGFENQPLVGSQARFIYESQPGLGSASGFNDSTLVPMWELGYLSSDFKALPDPKVLSTVIRHGNYDHVTGQVAWDPNIAEHNLPPSLYLTKKPAFFGDLPWPWVDATAATESERVKTLPAKERFKALP